MRIKRFEAPDARTAFSLVKDELGDDAVILAQKTLDGGTARQRVEIMAAVDYDVENVIAPLQEKTKAPPEKKPTIYSYNAVRKKNRKGSLAESLTADNEINFEAKDIRKRFTSILRKEGASPPIKNPLESPTKAPQPQAAKRPSPEEVERWRNQLIDQLLVAPPRISASPMPTILSLIGPTGVGKTTTSAKIAAWYKLRENRRVALLSMDCYRIGATDQLRTYARIMQMPCEIALRQKDLDKAIARHQHCDLIIIDTAGKSPYDPSHIAELSSWFSHLDHLEPQLVLSATTKKEDLQQIIDSYNPIGPTGLILTKLDETRSYATLCRQIAGTGIPVSYLGTGQRVPEDFFVASKIFLEDLFKKGWSAVQEITSAPSQAAEKT